MGVPPCIRSARSAPSGLRPAPDDPPLGGDLLVSPPLLTRRVRSCHHLGTRQSGYHGRVSQRGLNSEERRWVTTAEAAQFFHVGRRTIMRWADSGKLPCMKTLGGHRRYRFSDLRELYEQEMRVEALAARYSGE